MPPRLDEQQIQEYYRTQSSAANPLSPEQFLKNYQTQQSPAPTGQTAGVISTQDAMQDVTKADQTMKDLTKPPVTQPQAQQPQQEQKPTNEVSSEDLRSLFSQDQQQQELSPEDQAFQKRRDAANQQLADYKKELDGVSREFQSFQITDEELNQQIQQITSRWDSRIAEMQDINERRERAFETTGYRIGAQYTGGVRGGVFGGVIAEEERQGVTRIGELESQKQAEINAARQAAENQNWKVYVQTVQRAQEAYTNQLAEIENLNKLEVEQRKQMLEERKDLRVQTEFLDKRQQNTIESLAPKLIDLLTGDPEQDQQMYKMAASLYGVDANFLEGQVGEMKKKQEREAFNSLQGIARDYASYLQATGMSQDQVSMEDFLSIQDPAYQYKAQQAQLNLEKTGADIEQSRTASAMNRAQLDLVPLQKQKLQQEVAKVEKDMQMTSRESKLLSKQTQALASISLLRTLPGKGGAVGMGFQKALGYIPGIPDQGIMAGTAAAGYTAEIVRLKSLLTVPELEIMKGLGQMSERELEIVRGSATSLDPNMPEADFDRELGRLEGALQDSIYRTKAKEQGYTDADIDAYLNERDAGKAQLDQNMFGSMPSSGISGSTSPR